MTCRMWKICQQTAKTENSLMTNIQLANNLYLKNHYQAKIRQQMVKAEKSMTRKLQPRRMETMDLQMKGKIKQPAARIKNQLKTNKQVCQKMRTKDL